MQLPETLQEEWNINHDIDRVKNGMTLYYAPDGTVWYVSEIDPITITIKEHTTFDEWDIPARELKDSLYTDFFPIEHSSD
jgi:hypothetical protein